MSIRNCIIINNACTYFIILRSIITIIWNHECLMTFWLSYLKNIFNGKCAFKYKIGIMYSLMNGWKFIKIALYNRWKHIILYFIHHKACHFE